ncbi:hypothetical protein DPMN_046457 [Dreissena polymorpha]|uniref:Uncharacterized protein n=1 Tax=Dreissena polymorpha TaxID=45954 RepID=A0A9D4D6V0_DREPO|nr:hypothetical protein DPMN_046457 [Dreissena polymorpha]
MRYSRESKVFWKLGYRLFGGRFVHFMGGLKHHGQVVTEKGEKGCLHPRHSEINFAVPTKNILRQFDPYVLAEIVSENASSQGILESMISTLSENLD